ncbi:Spondin-2 [Acipenser ruthenus]|uniref:Spondin-2 n=1 Tax=Acipenser ruthenus TaxID=7906 RepID=A0A444UN80_ACIRT|nr:spondin-2-like [Acipenser ruthenus]RXM36652.1 Spondin-2 [Acipenser ruthenus]
MNLPDSVSLLSLQFLFSINGVLSGDKETTCQCSNTASYSLTFHAEWNPTTFPKQYPTHRPPAQWSRLFGCSHGSEDVIWADGALASPGMRAFVEEGDPEILEQELTAPEARTLHCFQADALRSGEGQQSTVITVEPALPLVSVLVRIVPSPDWFVGTNSLRLCKGGHWLETVVFDLFPWDAGTDSGFVFSSPNFATSPQEPISPITAQRPSHPANSFYYPRLHTLPRLGYLKLHLLATVSANTPGEGTNDTEGIVWNKTRTWTANITEQNRVTYKLHNITTDVIYDLENMVKQESPKPYPKGTPLDCEVSDWSPWSLCSHTCGRGLHQKTRYVLLQPANDGKPCPVLLQQQECEELQCPPKQLEEPPTSGALKSTVGNNTDLPSAVDILPQNGTLVFNGSLEGSNDKNTAVREPASTHIPYTHPPSPSHQNVIPPIHNSSGRDTQNIPAMLVTPPVITSFKNDSQP